jgi:hypothetical protein
VNRIYLDISHYTFPGGVITLSDIHDMIGYFGRGNDQARPRMMFLGYELFNGLVATCARTFGPIASFDSDAGSGFAYRVPGGLMMISHDDRLKTNEGFILDPIANLRMNIKYEGAA